MGDGRARRLAMTSRQAEPGDEDARAGRPQLHGADDDDEREIGKDGKNAMKSYICMGTANCQAEGLLESAPNRLIWPVPAWTRNTRPPPTTRLVVGRSKADDIAASELQSIRHQTALTGVQQAILEYCSNGFGGNHGSSGDFSGEQRCNVDSSHHNIERGCGSGNSDFEWN